jgi:hypothetical protein
MKLLLHCWRYCDVTCMTVMTHLIPVVFIVVIGIYLLLSEGEVRLWVDIVIRAMIGRYFDDPCYIYRCYICGIHCWLLLAVWRVLVFHYYWRWLFIVIVLILLLILFIQYSETVITFCCWRRYWRWEDSDIIDTVILVLCYWLILMQYWFVVVFIHIDRWMVLLLLLLLLCRWYC